MWRWIVRVWRTARTWLQVRIGLARGQWQRGAVRAPEASLLPPLARWWLVGSWRYGLYCPAGSRIAMSTADRFAYGCRQNALRFAVAMAGPLRRSCTRSRVPASALRAIRRRCWNWFAAGAARRQRTRGGPQAIDAVAQRYAIAAGSLVWSGVGWRRDGGATGFHHPDRFVAAVAVRITATRSGKYAESPRCHATRDAGSACQRSRITASMRAARGDPR
jgi:hypothetical protein